MRNPCLPLKPFSADRNRVDEGDAVHICEQNPSLAESMHPGKAIPQRPFEIKDRRIIRALDLIGSGQLTQISEIACVLHMSVSRFRHLFKREIGVSPIRYMKAIRLERADELLTNSFLSVKEIAAMLGGDTSHLAREYKARYGRTPSQAKTRTAARQ